MPKLLLVATIPETLCAFFLPHAQYFQQQGWQVDGAAYRASQAQQVVAVCCRTWSIDWSRNPLNPANLAVATRQMQKLVRTEGYDVVQVCTPVAAFVTRYALQKLPNTQRPKIVYTALGFHFYRGGGWLKNLVFRRLEQLAGPWTDALVVVNAEDHQAAQQYGIVPSTQIYAIPSGIGVDLLRFKSARDVSADRAHIYQELGLGGGDRLLLSIAEFIPRKRPEDVIRAVAQLARPDVHLAMAGAGPLQTKMRQLAQRLGIADRVHFLGFRQDIPALIQAAAAVVLASVQEGLPISLIEALCMGTPVIGSDIRGTRDLLQNGCGTLFPVGDIAALALAMGWVLDHPEAVQKLSDRGQAHARQYDVHQVIRQYEVLYQQLLQK